MSESVKTIIAVDLMYEDMQSAVQQKVNKDELLGKVKIA